MDKIDDVAGWIIRQSASLEDLELGSRDCCSWDADYKGVHGYTFDDGSTLMVAKGKDRWGFLRTRLERRLVYADRRKTV